MGQVTGASPTSGWNAIAARSLGRRSDRRFRMGRNVTLSIGALIVILILVALVF
jgi:hypothetical protein